MHRNNSQTIQDDGLMHIMSAADEMGATTPAGMPADESLPVSIPANVLPAGLRDDTYAEDTGLPAGFPCMLVADTLPAMLQYEGLASMPVATDPSAGEYPVSGDVVGQAISPMMPGYLDLFDTGSLQTNMPVLSSLFFG